uniref:Uncharacterized protein n=1 Tax=Arundo donax TaxID=35708 RepID=A0A0A9DV63_ARUDO
MVYRERVSQPRSCLPVQQNGIDVNFERIRQGKKRKKKSLQQQQQQ